MKNILGSRNKIFSILSCRFLKTAVFGLCTVVLLFLASVPVSAQTRITLEDKTYLEGKGKWFLQVGKKLFEVEPNVVTVKFYDNVKFSSQSGDLKLLEKTSLALWI